MTADKVRPVGRLRARFARAIYTAAWVGALPLAMLYLLWRGRAQPAYRQHWAERFRFGGAAAIPAKEKSLIPTIWLHAVSVGETRAAQPLIEALLAQYPQHRLLLTHMTPTGRETGNELFAERFASRLVQAYLPYDLPWFIDSFLAHYQPAIGLIMETELWPNLVASAERHKMPLVIVNARLSEKSLARGLQFRSLLAPALAQLSLVLAQTPEDAARMRRLAPANCEVAGNIKFDVLPKPALLRLGAGWRQRLAKPVVMLASSREGEEQVVLDAWQRAQTTDAMLVIVPRHPQRFGQVRQLMAHTGLPLSDRAAFDQPALGTEPHTVLLLGDSMGEMPAWYAMADIVIMGGSLLPFGGQNLIEACACGVPVLIGQSTYNFDVAAEQAIAAGAARRVDDAAAAVDLALALVKDPTALAAMAGSAGSFAQAHRGATETTLARIATFLEKP